MNRQLTPLQKTVIRFHLGIEPEDVSLQGIDGEFSGLSIDTVTEGTALLTVGPVVTVPPQSDRVTIAGEDLCSAGSLLGQVRAVYDKINATEIDVSLFVSEVETVKLRADQVQATERLYYSKVSDLADALGFKDWGRLQVGY